ncbi:MAG: HAD family hydrolase [Tannerella sp.]|jgi:putative hydrolase of the HAD superfamily|nr:HAD family hydrolase [Tannerella sp.]
MEISAKGLIFDYGGTIDTNGVHWGEVFRSVYERYSVPVTLDEFRNAYVQVERALGNGQVIHPDHTFEETLHIKLKLQFEILKINDLSLAGKIAEACYSETRQTTLRAAKILDDLKKCYPIVLASNFYGNLRTVLDEFNLSKYFCHVIESAEVGIRKPNPAIYALGIKALELHPEEVAIIGDSYKNDIHPANLLGCPSIWLKGKGWDNEDDAIEHPCIIKDFAMLRNLYPRH